MFVADMISNYAPVKLQPAVWTPADKPALAPPVACTSPETSPTKLAAARAAATADDIGENGQILTCPLKYADALP